MPDERAHSPDDGRLWTLLGVVELTYHPALAVAVLLAVGAVVSPMPAVRFDPLSLTVTGRGLPVTTVAAAVVLADLTSDVVGVYATGPTAARGDAGE